MGPHTNIPYNKMSHIPHAHPHKHPYDQIPTMPLHTNMPMTNCPACPSTHTFPRPVAHNAPSHQHPHDQLPAMSLHAKFAYTNNKMFIRMPLAGTNESTSVLLPFAASPEAKPFPLTQLCSRHWGYDITFGEFLFLAYAVGE